MKLWSRGLGRTELQMDFRYYEVVRDRESGKVCVVGTITDPVNWEFRIMMEPEDIPGFMKIFFNWPIVWLVIKNAFRYVGYLFRRKQYAREDAADIQEKVMKSYDTMMKRGRTKRARPKARLAEKDPDPDTNAA